MGLQPGSSNESLSGRECSGRQLRQRLRRVDRGRRTAFAGADRPRADLPENSGAGRGGAGRDSDLEQQGMSGFHLLTLLTVLPLVGAAIALVTGKHARAVALITTIASLALALVVWMRLPVNGSIGLIEQHAWAPSLGIEYTSEPPVTP